MSTPADARLTQLLADYEAQLKADPNIGEANVEAAFVIGLTREGRARA